MFLEDFLIYVRWRWNMWQKWFRNCRPLLDASVMYRFTRPCAIFTQLSFSLFIKHSILNSERFNMTLRQASRETFQILDDKLYSRIKSILNVSQQWIFQYQKNKQYIAEFAVRKMIFLDFAFKVGKLISKCVNGISFGALRRVYLRGCWMLFMGLWGTDTAGLWACATWLLSIVIVFWEGLVESCTESMGLFWLRPMTSTCSPLAALSEFGVLCWTIRIPPAFTAIVIEGKKKKRFLR